MKIIIAPDSYKGSLSAKEICDNLEIGIRNVYNEVEIIKVPMADGGEGTLDTLIDATNGKKIKTIVNDPLFRNIEAHYGILGNNKTAIIEMSRASGLTLLKMNERNPLVTTTYGTGELILHALNNGCRDFIIAIGGSATNDGGIGLLGALGVRFYDENDMCVELTGGGLYQIRKIDVSGMDPRIKESNFTIATDVQNILTGVDGAAYIYGPQKGANPLMVLALDRGLRNFAFIVNKDLGVNIENVKGAGAAGGLGGGLIGIINGKIKRGIDIVIEYTNLEEKLKDADLVITGEGRIDNQTQFGKTPYGVAKLAEIYNIPVVAVAGSLGDGYEKLYNLGFSGIFSIIDRPMSLDEAIERTPKLLIGIGGSIIRLLKAWEIKTSS